MKKFTKDKIRDLKVGIKLRQQMEDILAKVPGICQVSMYDGGPTVLSDAKIEKSLALLSKYASVAEDLLQLNRLSKLTSADYLVFDNRNYEER